MGAVNMQTTWLLLLVISFSAGKTYGFSDLENFIRVIGSLNPNETVVNYLNGSVFWKQPKSILQKLFNYEGYNINRKIRQSDGTFLSLSREFVVYRQPNTSEILQVWMNPISNNANEVFNVANDPVNAHIGSATPAMPVPPSLPKFLVYNTDIVLEYPNPLQPDNYANYSAGPIYDSVELFGFFSNSTLVNASKTDSVPMTGTWMRKSQYLPWMVLGTTPGSLFYTTLAWKCSDGLQCVADDIMQIIKQNFPKYQYAPSTEEVPNETSWTAFKKIIDQRRLAGLPDIIIPQVNASSDVRDMTYDVDQRVLDILYKWPITVRVNGTAWSEITGQQGIALFDVGGYVGVDLEPLFDYSGYRLQLDGALILYNRTTHAVMQNFHNPITGRVNKVKPLEVAIDLIFRRDSFFTVDIPSSEIVGLIGAQSTDTDNGWAVNMLNILFPWQPGTGNLSSTFYGTWSSFASWPEFMVMGDTPGNIVQKLTVTNGM
ncbi:hypothetical protein DPMN_134386 [Dreissena polymorpha]|uniref:Uncharacterized protein n=2 Tax=Dreissena polymorpha TaxID=45954 RepID=A0A9D4G1X7_DREPO|nr:hypothetical protein DPMN_134386 [Dreissena polymorpha]